MIKLKKCLAMFMAGALIMTGGILPQESKANAAGDYGISNPRVENGVTTWDKIKFGSYYQDAEFEPEPIKWRVLSVDGDDAFLLADKCLDCKPYNEEYTDVTWETCTLRKWLNEDFYNEAFDSEEKAAITETTVINNETIYNDGEDEYITKDGNDTKDNVYLLSIDEVCNTAYGFNVEFSEAYETRYVKVTDYVKVKGADYENGYWWLRSPGDFSNYASCVNFYGFGDNCGCYADNAVRPALHINLSSSKVKDAGEVDSEGNVTEQADGIDTPRVKDGVTTWDCVYFGNYKQNAEWRKQDVEWRVLSVNGNDAFLLADRNLNCKPYNEENIDVTWETCTLRKWLNEEFYNEAFDAEEKSAIIETKVINDDNPCYDTDGGNDTKDNVYLLSIDEACNSAYGFDSEFDRETDADSDENPKTRYSKNTDYTILFNGAGMVSGPGYKNNGNWWLRSTGFNSTYASFVYHTGYGEYKGKSVNAGNYVVRPALHINLSSSEWSKAGTISANNQIKAEPIEEPDDYGNKPDVPTQVPTPPYGNTGNNLKGVQQASQTANTVQKQTTDGIAAKTLKLKGVKCIAGSKKITGKVSLSKAKVKIKVGSRAYKKAAVKGKKFTLRLGYKLRKNTKVTIKVTKKGCKGIVKQYKVKQI